MADEINVVSNNNQDTLVDCFACFEKVKFDFPTGGEDDQALWIKNLMVIKQKVAIEGKGNFFIEQKVPWTLMIVKEE